MVDDPQTLIAAIDEVVIRDPAIVHKLLQVINSPVWPESGTRGIGHCGKR